MNSDAERRTSSSEFQNTTDRRHVQDLCVYLHNVYGWSFYVHLSSFYLDWLKPVFDTLYFGTHSKRILNLRLVWIINRLVYINVYLIFNYSRCFFAMVTIEGQWNEGNCSWIFLLNFFTIPLRDKTLYVRTRTFWWRDLSELPDSLEVEGSLASGSACTNKNHDKYPIL